ncbi:MAG: DUF5916 domain-containing protein [bacterium]
MPYTHYTRLAVTGSALAVTLIAARQLPAQQADCWRHDTAHTVDSSAARARRVATAARITGAAPHIDGRLDDPAWCAAQPMTDFIQSRPRPGNVATLPTVARVLFDDAAIYVAVRMYDPHPDSILAPYPRRDDEVSSDWTFVEMDTRLDRRSGYSFGVNPRGVQVDGTWYGDVNYDPSWNSVWEAATSIDAEGWIAEYRIPFSQMALGHADAGNALTIGMNVYRYTPHRGETSNWSPRLPTVLGVVSHFNDVTGIVVPPRHTPAEFVPYAATTGVHDQSPFAVTAKSGADLRIRPTPNTLVAATIHPDFGQVEADPSLVNLTTFETLLTEQRPFFIEGADLFRFDAGLQFSTRETSFADENPFYSRRLGASPHGAGSVAVIDLPSATTVLGALRASGRTPDGWSGGVFQGETARTEATAIDSNGVRRPMLVEPLTNFSVARVARELRDGRVSLGAMTTLVSRSGMNAAVDSMLVRSALVSGIDGRIRFHGDDYEATGFVMTSRLAGSPNAIRVVRDEPRHGYDRPTASGVAVARDTSLSSLDGVAAQVTLAHVNGSWKWGVANRVVTQGFEANDAGFQRNANWILTTVNWKYEQFPVGHLLRHWSIGSQQLGAGWTVGGDRRAAVANLAGAFDLRNYWGGTVSVDHEFSSFDPEVLRGGPSLLLPESNRVAATLFSDSRKRWQLTLSTSVRSEPVTASHSVTVSPDITAFVTDRLQLGLAASFGSAAAGWQYVAQPVDALGQTRYLLGALTQRTASLTSRATYAFSPHLTLQGYAQAFGSGGTYDAFREVVNARAARADDRVATLSASRVLFDNSTSRFTFDAGAPNQFTFLDPAFSRRDFHLNGLLRYEYSPGSTFFLVWTQQRFDSDLESFGVGRDLRRLWNAPVANALLMKVSYWFAR